MRYSFFLASLLAFSVTRGALAVPPVQLQHLGPLYIAMPERQVVAALGAPASRSPFERDSISGWRFQSWSYPDRGLRLRMISQGSAAGLKIWGVTARPPCQLRTTRDVAIGSSRDAVTDAYHDSIERKASSESEVVAGKRDDALVFDFKKGRVAEIRLGPGAP